MHDLRDLEERLPCTPDACRASSDSAAKHLAEQWDAILPRGNAVAFMVFRYGYIAGRQPFELPASVDFFRSECNG